MTITLFALLAFLMAARTPGLNRLAFSYLLVMSCLTLWTMHYEANLEWYGAWWFGVCMLAEAGIILASYKIKSDASAWVRWASAFNLAVHSGAVASGIVPAFNLFYDLWGELLLIGEVSQVVALMVFSRPIFVPLQRWYDSRKSRKGKATWLARSTQAG